MTALQQGLAHLILTVAAIVAATVLAATGHVDGTDTLAIIVAAAGIGGTGIAGVTSTAVAVRAAPPAVAAKPVATVP